MPVGGINGNNVNLDLLLASKAESWKASVDTRDMAQQFMQRTQKQSKSAVTNGFSKAEVGRNQSANFDEGADNAAEQSKSPAASRDEYTPGEEAVKPTGVYKLKADGNGGVQIVIEPPDSAEQNRKSSEPEQASRKDGVRPKEMKPEETGPEENRAEKTGGAVVSTDRVNAEINQLKAKRDQMKQRLEQVGNTGDEDKRQEAEMELLMAESEFRSKDTDAYRKANATVTYF